MGRWQTDSKGRVRLLKKNAGFQATCRVAWYWSWESQIDLLLAVEVRLNQGAIDISTIPTKINSLESWRKLKASVLRSLPNRSDYVKAAVEAALKQDGTLNNAS